MIKQVVCIDRCPKIRPYVKTADMHNFPSVRPGTSYIAIEEIEDSGKIFYRLQGFPPNHVFDKRAFNDVKPPHQ